MKERGNRKKEYGRKGRKGEQIEKNMVGREERGNR